MDVVLDWSPVSQDENLSSISTGSYLPCSLLYPKAIVKGLHKAKIKYKYINEANQLISSWNQRKMYKTYEKNPVGGKKSRNS